jgi:hypothetical protein
MTLVPTRAAICILEESMVIIRSSLFMKTSSSLRLSFPTRLVEPAILH